MKDVGQEWKHGDHKRTALVVGDCSYSQQVAETNEEDLLYFMSEGSVVVDSWKKGGKSEMMPPQFWCGECWCWLLIRRLGEG